MRSFIVGVSRRRDLFNSSEVKPSHQRPTIRDTLFGDMPLSQLLLISPETLASEPWASFKQAKDRIDSGNAAGAMAPLQGILKMPHLESRHYLQAWHFLREIGVNTPEKEAKNILGVIVEVGVKD